MKTRMRIVPALGTVLLLAGCLIIGGCGSLQRAGKDIAVVGTSPLTIPLNATYDSLDWNEDTESAVPILLFPFNFGLHALKNVGYTLVYGIDLLFSPLYLVASVDPDNDLEPIGLYRLNDGYPWRTEPVPALEGD